MAIVYQHVRKDTGYVFYIGIGKHKNRAYSKSGRNKHWHGIVNKVGYDVEILIEGISIEVAKCYETLLISIYGRQDKKSGILVNMTDGGEFNSHSNSTETRLKLSKSWNDERRFNHKKIMKLYWTDERKQDLSIKLSGSNAYWYGKKGLGAPMFGKKQSDKFKNSNRDYMLSDRNPSKKSETRTKMSIAKLGDKNPNARAVERYYLDGTYIDTWDCIASASKELHIFHIDQVCLGHRKTAGGYIWKYKQK